MSPITVEGSLWQHWKCANSGKLWFTVMFKVLPKAHGVDMDFQVLFLLLLLFLIFLMMKNEFPAVLWVAPKLAVISFYCVTAKPGLWLRPLRPQMTGHRVADSIFKTFIWLDLFCCCSFQKNNKIMKLTSAAVPENYNLSYCSVLIFGLLFLSLLIFYDNYYSLQNIVYLF